jgi:hypothetical protein
VLTTDLLISFKEMFEATSSGEKEFIRTGCDANIRFDGRGITRNSRYVLLAF